MGYAAVLGEALIDLLEDTSGGESCYRPAVGGAPFNVAVGVARLAAADVVYTGSIAMLRPPTLAAARAAWRLPGPRKVFDPNARPRLLTDVAAYRAVVEEFAAGADLIKLSSADAAILWDTDEQTVARRLGAGTVVVTRGAAGALVRHAGGVVEIPAPTVTAVDTTGAGDSVMAALVHGLLLTGRDTEPDWPALVRYALAVGALTVQGRGGATALPTAERVREQFPQVVPSSSP